MRSYTLLPILYAECSKKLKYFSDRYWSRYLSNFNDFCNIENRLNSAFEWRKNRWNPISTDLNNDPKSIWVFSNILHTILAGGYINMYRISMVDNVVPWEFDDDFHSIRKRLYSAFWWFKNHRNPIWTSNTKFILKFLIAYHQKNFFFSCKNEVKMV